MKQRRLPRRQLTEIRAQFIRMLEDDVPAEAIKSALQLSRATYFEWKRLYLSGGSAALEVRPHPGGKSKLTDAQTSQLYRWLVGADPRQFQFDFALWTRMIVGDLITQKFGVTMTPQGIGKLLHRLGLSPQRPLYRASQQDPEAVRHWREDQYPSIHKRAAQEGATIYFADEAGLRADHHAGTTWAPVGQTPVVETHADRTGFNMISAVTALGVLHFEVFTGRFTAEVFIDYLTRLLHDTPTPVFLILDNHPVHKSRRVRDWVAEQDRLTVFFLPPYSPELNPDEWVWKNVKHDQVGRAAILRKSEFHARIDGALRRLQHLTDTVRGFFGDPSLAYIRACESA